MAVKGIGSNYLYPAQNDYTPDSKAEDIEKSVSYTTVQSEGVCYEKTISDSVSAGLEFMQGMEKQLPGTKFFVGTVSYGQTYGNSSDINFVVNPKFLGKLGTDETVKKQFVSPVLRTSFRAQLFQKSLFANRAKSSPQKVWAAQLNSALKSLQHSKAKKLPQNLPKPFRFHNEKTVKSSL